VGYDERDKFVKHFADLKENATSALFGQV